MRILTLQQLVGAAVVVVDSVSVQRGLVCASATGEERLLDRSKTWSQSGTVLSVSSYAGTFTATMPLGWRLSDVPNNVLQVAEAILFARAEQIFTGARFIDVERALADAGPGQPFGDVDLLSFSLGQDSTAAYHLLPDSTVPFYVRRTFSEYRRADGALIPMASTEALDERLDTVDGLVTVATDFELIGPALGTRKGFAHSFGYSVIGLLLAPFLGARSIAFGSVMEQVFLKSGYNYTDVVALPSSALNLFRRLVHHAGIEVALPTGGLSEVLTNRLAAEGRLGGLAISCPKASGSGVPCGTCFKCFRKERLERSDSELPPPDPSVLKVLETHPLKSGTSVLYAAQQSGFTSPHTDQLLTSIDLTFLDRYHGYAFEHLVSHHYRDDVLGELRSRGIEPMATEDELWLRNVGSYLDPEEYDPVRAGVACRLR
jgi:hypothetical protein